MVSLTYVALLVLLTLTNEICGEEVTAPSIIQTNATTYSYDIVFHATDEESRLCSADFNHIKQEMFPNDIESNVIVDLQQQNIKYDNEAPMLFDNNAIDVFKQDMNMTLQKERKLQVKDPYKCWDWVCDFYNDAQLKTMRCYNYCTRRRRSLQETTSRELQTSGTFQASYTIVRARLDLNYDMQAIASYTNGGTINVAGYSNFPLSLVIHYTCCFASVKLRYSSNTINNYEREEYVAPYSINGNSGGWFNEQNDLKVPGLKTITLEGFNSAGTRIARTILSFTVINQSRRLRRRSLLSITSSDDHHDDDIGTNNNSNDDNSNNDNKVQQESSNLYFENIPTNTPLDDVISQYHSIVEQMKENDASSQQCKLILRKMSYSITPSPQ